MSNPLNLFCNRIGPVHTSPPTSLKQNSADEEPLLRACCDTRQRERLHQQLNAHGERWGKRKRKRPKEWKEGIDNRDRQRETGVKATLILPDTNLLSARLSDGCDKVHHPLVMRNRGK